MEMNEMNDVAKFLFEKKISTHIDTLNNDFYNGLIIELNTTFIVIDDRVTGLTPIPFSEIKNIEKFREKENGK
jgi:hypothetical protein